MEDVRAFYLCFKGLIWTSSVQVCLFFMHIIFISWLTQKSSRPSQGRVIKEKYQVLALNTDKWYGLVWTSCAAKLWHPPHPYSKKQLQNRDNGDFLSFTLLWWDSPGLRETWQYIRLPHVSNNKINEIGMPVDFLSSSTRGVLVLHKVYYAIALSCMISLWRMQHSCSGELMQYR